MRRQARQSFTIDAETLGSPRLRPGKWVEIRGLGPPFDGFFYVTRAIHTLNEQGYRTRISGERAGMPIPPAPAGSTSQTTQPSQSPSSPTTQPSQAPASPGTGGTP